MRVCPTHLHFTSRADMRVVVDTLADPPEGEWVVSVAESGQKHSLPYAVVNRGRARWRVRMDALDADATPEDFRHVFAHVCALRAREFSAPSRRSSGGMPSASAPPREPGRARGASRDPAPIPPSAAHRRGDATGEFSVRHPESFELTYKLIEETQ